MSCDILSASRCLFGVEACRFLNAEPASLELICSNTLSFAHHHSHEKAAANTCAHQTIAVAAAVEELELHTAQDWRFLQLISSDSSVTSLGIFL